MPMKPVCSLEGQALKMGQSQQPLNKVEKERLGTHIDNIPRLKLSEFGDGVRPHVDVSFVQDRDCLLGCREPTPFLSGC